DRFSNIVAQADASDGECRIAVYLLSVGATVEHAAYVIAHEFFHCVQEASLSPAQMGSSGAGTGVGGDWWIEGSAEWFAALSLPELGPLDDRIHRFDSVSADTPLYEMAYEAVVFFLWMEFECGEWATEDQPGESYATRAEGGSWGDLPESIDTDDGGESRFRLVGF